VEPAVVVAVRSSALPEQTGELLPRVGAGGVWLITTNVVFDERHIPNIAVTVYTPEDAVVTGVMFGFCKVDENAGGPDQL
jgi:hypothetical protein